MEVHLTSNKITGDFSNPPYLRFNNCSYYHYHPPPVIMMLMNTPPVYHHSSLWLQPISSYSEQEHNKKESHQVYVFQNNRKSYPSELDPRVKYYQWSKVPKPFFVLNADGSLRENQAGIGGIIRDGEGTPLVAFSSKSECKGRDLPVYLIELLAIKRGLMEGFFHGVKNIVINSDSLLAVDYVMGRKDCFRDDVAKEIEDVRELLKNFEMWDCKHVYRETNRAADYLSTFIEDDDTRKDVLLYPNEFPKKLAEIVNDMRQDVYT